MSETQQDLEHRVAVLERELQILRAKLRDGTTSESLNGVDVVRSSNKPALGNDSYITFDEQVVNPS
jgi:hypothetical protein